MRAAALLLLWPAAALAEPLAETHFALNFCWETAFSRDALAEHPDQAVTAFRIVREPLGWSVAPGKVAMQLRVTFRGGESSLREGPEMRTMADCQPDGERMHCFLEQDGRGDFELQAQDDDLLLSVGEQGMRFEGDDPQELRADEGDDKAFVLHRCG